MKNFIKRIMGIDKLEQAQAQLLAETQARLLAEIAKLTKTAEEAITPDPKTVATEAKEPWIAVLDTHVFKDNIRNGFFELDWNEYFVLQLRAAGYVGDSDEAIVDQWFNELCRNIGSEEGVNMDRRGAGFINVNNLGNGKTEIS